MAKSIAFLEKTALPDDFSTTFGNPGINIFNIFLLQKDRNNKGQKHELKIRQNERFSNVADLL
jgi:hypothetical protein